MRTKKILLSALVILTFIFYSYQQKNEGKAVIIKPPAQTAQNQANSTTSNSSSSNQSGSSGTTSQPSTTYKDGMYTGDIADAFYGNIQVQVTIQSGKITDVQFLQYPNDRENSIRINQEAMPYLRQEAIQAQSAQVNIISGATDTSRAFIESLSSALAKA